MFKFVEKFTYRFFGCFYAKFQNRLFKFVEGKIPSEFLNREISDLGCGDGFNTIRIKNIFKAKSIVGYEFNKDLLKKARKKGVLARPINLNQEMPQGEMAIFNFSLHHLDDKELVLKRAVNNFKYLVLLEPLKDCYHAVFDAGGPLKKQDWIKIFDRMMKDYSIHHFRGFVLVFYKKQ